MGDPSHIDKPSGVVNLVHNTVISDSNSPFLIATLELLTPRRPRSRREMFQARHNASDHLGRQHMQFLGSACRQSDPIANHARVCHS